MKSQLRTLLEHSPETVGYNQREWSGALLARHLSATSGLSLTARHCRRLIGELGSKKALLTLVSKRTEAVSKQAPSRPAPWSDEHRKQVAFKRIKRLCAAGLPLRPLALTLMDLVGDAIAQTELRIMTADFTNHMWLSSQDLAPIAPKFGQMLTMSPDKHGLTLDPASLARQRTWSHEEVEIGRFEKSVGYNEFGRHLGYHHILELMLHDDRGSLGCLPLWRSEKMPPFTRADREFLNAIGPHVDHALSLASRSPSEKLSTERAFEKLATYGSGIAMVDQRGRILALDEKAKSIFYHSGREQADFGLPAFSDGQLARSLEYVARVLGQCMANGHDGDFASHVPAVCMLAHHSGYQIRMRGYAADGEIGKGYFVIVEALESRELFKQRVRYRYGLSARQTEIIMLLPECSNREIATRIGIRPATLEKSLRELADKLELNSRSALRRFSSQLRAGAGVPDALPPPSWHLAASSA